MTIRRRLTIWYGAVLAVSLLLFAAAAYDELAEQADRRHQGQPMESALEEAGEIILKVGLPAIVLGAIGGWLLTRRALRPLADLTKAAQRVDERTLDRPLPQSGNGDELDQLAGVLNAMQARLNDSFNRIREFTLHASHELKTPLTVMHAELETALREQHVSEEDREHILNQLDELRRLSKIVDGLTLLTRADTGQVKLKKEALRLDQLVRDIHEDAVILAEPSGITVELTACDPAIIHGDAHRLRQLFLNLADNAVKYNVHGGSITMSSRMGGSQAEFTIANTGPGIPREMLPRVFDRFFRADPARGKEVEGCGLGLSIVQWITNAHGGTIRIDSVPAKLTTVTVRFPASASPIDSVQEAADGVPELAHGPVRTR